VQNVSCVLLALMLCSGCAFWRTPPPPGFQRVALVAEVERSDDGEVDGDTHADTTIKGALIGAGLGTVGGATTGGVIGAASSPACGPFVALCVAVNTAVGVIVGGIGGFLVGGVMGGIGGLPWKTCGEINEILEDLQRTRDLTGELQETIEVFVPRETQVGEAAAEAVVTVRFEKVDLRQHRSERLSFRMWATMVQEWERDRAKPKTYTCKYEYTTPVRDVEDWLLDGGRPFGDAFTDAINAFARWVARDLEAFSTRTARPETDRAPETCFQGE
jgi:hypothetical protein